VYAYLGIQNFIANLTAPLAPDEVTPSLRYDHVARLCAGLSGDSHTYLTIECPGTFEIVRARCDFGVIVMDRGQDGTSPRNFPLGACVRFAFVGAAIKDLVNETIACPRPCIPASIKSGGVPADGQVGVPYEHRVVISGTPPFNLGIFEVPQWMVVELDAGELRLSGTPDIAGVANISIPLNSCGELKPFLVACITVAPA
jgi:hypothetical protein